MRQTRTPQRLDPRDPLVLDTRELGRRPGSMRPWQRVVPAPAPMGLGLTTVAEGSDVELDLRLESVVEGVLVSGTVRAVATGECGRCLDPVEIPITAELVELYAYPGDDKDGGGPDEDEVSRLEGDFIPLEARLRDAVVLALPLRPVCRTDCPGLCATCGARLADVPTDHAHDEMDSRWSALSRLVAGGSGNDNAEQADEER
jgi:uncharacterized protein